MSARRNDEDGDYVDVDDPRAACPEAPARSTTWWGISLAFHGVVLAALPFIIFWQQLVGEGRPDITVTIGPTTQRIDLGTRAAGKVFFAGAGDSDDASTTAASELSDRTGWVVDPKYEHVQESFDFGSLGVGPGRHPAVRVTGAPAGSSDSGGIRPGGGSYSCRIG